MPNKETHIIIAIIPLVIIAYFYGYQLLVDYWIHVAFFIFGSILPDIIEPAFDYDHRDFFHSVGFAKFLVVALVISIILGLSIDERILYIVSISCGYLLHLFLDSLTPMGLPK